MLAALNSVQIKNSDIKNAYLTAQAEERLYSIFGPKFGKDEGGKAAIIVRVVLYGTKLAISLV